MNIKKLYQCSSPLLVKNPYTGDVISVPCGHCYACRMQKSSRAELLCNMQCSASKYVEFITLTYNNDWVPCLSPELNSDGTLRGFISCSRSGMPYRSLSAKGIKIKSYVDVDSFFVPASSMTYSQYVDLAAKTHLEYYKNPITGKIIYHDNGQYLKGKIPYAERRDVQLFKKRLRYYFVKYLNLSKDELKKIHIYEVSEYGPQTFRPHFHLLLCHDSQKISDTIRRCVTASWRLGGHSTEHVSGSCSSYVAGYANSYVSLPDFYAGNNKIRPYSRFSNHFGQSFITQDVEEAKVTGDNAVFVDGALCILNGRPVRCRPPRSYIARLLYRPIHRLRTSDVANIRFVEGSAGANNVEDNSRFCSEVLKSFREMAKFGFFASLDSPMQAAVTFYSFFLGYRNSNHSDISSVFFVANVARILDDQVDVDRAHRSLYCLFNRLRNFAREWFPSLPVDSIPYGSWHRAFCRVDEIVSAINMKMLNHFYSLQEEASEDPLLRDLPMVYWYPASSDRDALEAWSHSPFMKWLNSINESVAHERIKHKKLNDLNNLLISFLNQK